MFSMPLAPSEGERPPVFESLAAAVAVGYTAGYNAGSGSVTWQAVGAVVVSIVGWLWAKGGRDVR
ncbi:hypothetical protein R6V09_12935 [Streptomyces sp. W16]|uniref:hypothetical protein n=1 Tax=Streptomyces sp. W16 TaxID=3076631 RepID=UPI00295BDCDA|nr:hypothetical protein [Streptomyces sp. W16]MDV9171036.1 hypothetical protein [Streptomyces sp. W16]